MSIALDCMLAVVVFAGIVCRLAGLERCRHGERARLVLSWHGWVAANIAVGLGALELALAPLIGDEPPRIGITLMLAGMAALVGIRWRRRSRES